MRPLLFAMMLSLAACSGGGGGMNTASDPRVRCPDDPNQALSRDEWRACYGRQDHDGKGGK